MERPTSKRLTDVSRHSIDTLRFVPHLTAASSDMTDLFKASGRGSHAIRHALTPILLKLGHCAALQDLNQCFLTNSINCLFVFFVVVAFFLGHTEDMQNVDEDITQIFSTKKCFSIMEIWIYRCCIELQCILKPECQG